MRSIVFYFVSVLTLFLVSCSSSPSVVYMNIERVFNEFTLKEDLLTEFEVVKNKRQAITDSLRLSLKAKYNEISQLKDQKLKEKSVLAFKDQEQYYYDMMEEYKDMNSKLMNQYDAQILKRMNEFVQQFGKDHSYELILGSKGDGNIMYAVDGKDVTSEVILYINKKFEDEP